jgi:uncharacterized protein DUF3575
MRNRVLAVAAAALMPFAAASAQANAAPRNVLSIQPLNAMMTVYSGEYERAVGKSVTFGLGATYWGADDDTGDEASYTSGDVKLRFYPSGAALMGFSFGASAGYSSVSATEGTTSTKSSESAPSFGVLLEYQWLMGVKKNFSVALGAGAKMLFIEENTTNDNVIGRYPTARVSVGYAW